MAHDNDMTERLDAHAGSDSRGFVFSAEPEVIVINGTCRPIVWTREEIEALEAPPLASAVELLERANAQRGRVVDAADDRS